MLADGVSRFLGRELPGKMPLGPRWHGGWGTGGHWRVPGFSHLGGGSVLLPGTSLTCVCSPLSVTTVARDRPFAEPGPQLGSCLLSPLWTDHRPPASPEQCPSGRPHCPFGAPRPMSASAVCPARVRVCPAAGKRARPVTSPRLSHPGVLSCRRSAGLLRGQLVAGRVWRLLEAASTSVVPAGYLPTRVPLP